MRNENITCTEACSNFGKRIPIFATYLFGSHCSVAFQSANSVSQPLFHASWFLYFTRGRTSVHIVHVSFRLKVFQKLETLFLLCFTDSNFKSFFKLERRTLHVWKQLVMLFMSSLQLLCMQQSTIDLPTAPVAQFPCFFCVVVGVSHSRWGWGFPSIRATVNGGICSPLTVLFRSHSRVRDMNGSWFTHCCMIMPEPEGSLRNYPSCKFQAHVGTVFMLPDKRHSVLLHGEQYES